MSIHLQSKDLINPQQMEVAVNGPDGATHLIFCTGIALLDLPNHEILTFLVGPHISRRQFVGAIASAAPLIVSGIENNTAGSKNELILVDADYDEDAGQVKVQVKALYSKVWTKTAICYSVYILAELPKF